MVLLLIWNVELNALHAPFNLWIICWIWFFKFKGPRIKPLGELHVSMYLNQKKKIEW